MPVVSDYSSNTLGLSNIVSDMVESLCLSMTDPLEVISSEDLRIYCLQLKKSMNGLHLKVMIGERNTC